MKRTQIREFYKDMAAYGDKTVTVGGWAMEVLGKIPEVGDSFEEYGIAVEVTEMDGRRVESVHVFDKREDESDDDREDERNEEKNED